MADTVSSTIAALFHLLTHPVLLKILIIEVVRPFMFMAASKRNVNLITIPMPKRRLGQRQVNQSPGKWLMTGGCYRE